MEVCYGCRSKCASRRGGDCLIGLCRGGLQNALVAHLLDYAAQGDNLEDLAFLAAFQRTEGAAGVALVGFGWLAVGGGLLPGASSGGLCVGDAPEASAVQTPYEGGDDLDLVDEVQKGSCEKA